MTKSVPERIALIDMDGTVADYESAIEVSYDRLRNPENEACYKDASRCYGRDTWPDHLWNRMDAIKRRPGFWRNLEPLEIGFEIIDVLATMGFSFHIATQGPSTKSAAWAEKLDWAREHMPFADVNVTENKSLLYGKVLVDDWPPFGLDWLKHRPRGIVIMPAAHYNKDIEHPQIFRYEEGMQEQLEQCVSAIL